jgi:hypothetical protein
MSDLAEEQTDASIISMFDRLADGNPNLSTEEIMLRTVEVHGITWERFCKALARELDRED